MKRVVVFGATGTVGAYLCKYLAERHYKIVAVGSRNSDNGFFAQNGMTYHSVDIRDERTFEPLPKTNVYAVVNLAGLLPARMSGYSPQKYIDINISGALNIIKYSVDCKAKKFIYSQSISDVDYLCGSKTPIDSDAPSHFPINNDHSVYSITKNAAASLLQHYSARYGFKFYILRFPNIYLYHPNPFYFVNGEKKWQSYRLIIHKAMHGEPIEIWGDPTKVKDIVYVKDCCQIIEKCISVENAESGNYNVGTGVGVSVEEQIKGIVEVFSPKNSPSIITYAPDKPDAQEYIFDISKVRKNLGYTPQYTYVEYLQDFKQEMERQTFSILWGTDLVEK